MTKQVTLSVRVGGGLRDHVADNIGDYGNYDNASEYVRDLIRRDLERVEAERLAAWKAELQQAFAVREDDCIEMDAAAFFAKYGK